jgi:hypothetical protein
MCWGIQSNFGQKVSSFDMSEKRDITEDNYSGLKINIDSVSETGSYMKLKRCLKL